MNNTALDNLRNPETGAFILRVSLGTVLLAHSVYLKLMVFTLPGLKMYRVKKRTCLI